MSAKDTIYKIKLISKYACVGHRQIRNILESEKQKFRADAIYIYAYAQENGLALDELKSLIDGFVVSKKVLKERL